MCQWPKDSHSPCLISVAVQTSFAEPEAPHSLPSTTPTRMRLPPRELRTDIEDLRAHIDLLSEAINDFTKERRTTRETFKPRSKPTDPGSDPPPASPHYASDDNGASSISHSPPQYQLPLELPVEPPSQPPLHKPLPDLQHILRVEQECLR